MAKPMPVWETPLNALLRDIRNGKRIAYTDSCIAESVMYIAKENGIPSHTGITFDGHVVRHYVMRDSRV